MTNNPHRPKDAAENGDAEVLKHLIGGWRSGKKAADAVKILRQGYSLQIEGPYYNQISDIAQRYELATAHDVAVIFLRDFTETINMDHPKAKAEVIKYVKRVKIALAQELVNAYAAELLFQTANERFGVDASEFPDTW